MPRRIAVAVVALVASSMMSGVTAPAHAQAEDEMAPGGISGRVTTADGLSLDYGFVTVFDAVDGTFVSETPPSGDGSYLIDGLSPGEYYVLFSNSDDTTWYYYFPVLYDEAPIWRLDQATTVTVEAGRTTARIDGVLEPLFEDMFDTVFTEDIFWMRSAAITAGCAENLFCPDDHVTRGQMAAFLVRAFQLGGVPPAVSFSDDEGSVFEADIERLATVGVTRGCGDDRFCPDEPVTRGQMAAFLVRAMGYADRGSVDFSDDDGSMFEGDIERLATAGVTSGCNSTEFCPDDPVTRGQMAAFLHRALGGGVIYPAGDRASAAQLGSGMGLAGR